jgi:hypothetical protein
MVVVKDMVFGQRWFKCGCRAGALQKSIDRSIGYSKDKDIKPWILQD